MYDYQTMLLMHHHRDSGEWAEMAEGPAPERRNDSGQKLIAARFFRCRSCDEVIAISSEARHEGEGEHRHA